MSPNQLRYIFVQDTDLKQLLIAQKIVEKSIVSVSTFTDIFSTCHCSQAWHLHTKHLDCSGYFNKSTDDLKYKEWIQGIHNYFIIYRRNLSLLRFGGLPGFLEPVYYWLLYSYWYWEVEGSFFPSGSQLVSPMYFMYTLFCICHCTELFFVTALDILGEFKKYDGKVRWCKFAGLSKIS